MQLTVQQVMDATLVISQIIREERPMPQKGKYLLARMHAKLIPEFTTINEQRDALIKAYDHRQQIEGADGIMVDGENYAVPMDKMPEFNEAWKKIGDEMIDVGVEPIPLAAIDLGSMSDGSISAKELITLGDLVKG